MKRVSSVLIALFFATSSFSQMAQPMGNLTIFSEDGYKFYLILNGERQNDKAETNIKVEELTNPYYTAKIIFEDKTQGEISKNALMITDAEGTFQDVTYKIKKDKNGKNLLRYFSSIPVAPNMPPVRPQGVSVYSFGNHTPIFGSTVVQQTTTSVGNPTNTNVGVNVGGVGVNIQVNEPVINATTTTTTTTTTNVPSTMPSRPDPRPNPYANCQGNMMGYNDLKDAKAAIEDAGFEGTKLTTAKQIADANCMSTDQIIEICQLFGFESSKLDFAKYAHKRCIDKNAYYKVNKVFGFDSSKTELSKFTSGK